MDGINYLKVIQFDTLEGSLTEISTLESYKWLNNYHLTPEAFPKIVDIIQLTTSCITKISNAASIKFDTYKLIEEYITLEKYTKNS